jgi:Zn-dependent protease with chaperone function
MFALRGIAVSLSVFAMVYCVLSIVMPFLLRAVQLRTRNHSVRQMADLLFALRMFPLITAGLITAIFAIPSFLLLEPRTIEEPLGGVPLTVGACGVGLAIFGFANAGVAMRRVSRAISTWTGEAQLVESCANLPILRIAPVVPAMTTVGIVHPRVLMSGAAELMLGTNELHTALNHEIAHVRRRDNLKKLLFRFVAFPGMSDLENAWLEATEMTADDAAVSSVAEALDLASALIKLSRLGPLEPQTDLTTALVHDPTSAMNARVERLIAWKDEPHVTSSNRLSGWHRLSVVLITIAIFALTYTQLLSEVHTATEWLVR